MSNVTGYNRAQIAIHWGTLLLLAVSYFSSDKMKAAWKAVHDGRDAYGNTAAAHVWVGVALLALVLLRMAIRQTRGVPELPAGGHPVADLAARLTHLGLYALLLLMPVSGIVAWFGGIDAAGEAHEVMFNLGLALVIVHVAGAFYHQFVLKDDLMARMKRAS
ncbi:MAG: cytochrome b [Albidovulum sp.]